MRLLSIFASSLFSSVVNGLSPFRVRALKQSCARLFDLRKSHALPAVQFTTRPAARTKTLHEDRQFGIENKEALPLACFNAEQIPVLFHAHDRIYFSVWPDENVRNAKLRRMDDGKLSVQSGTQRRGGISTKGTGIHGTESASARARRQGTGVPGLLREAPTKRKLEMALCS